MSTPSGLDQHSVDRLAGAFTSEQDQKVLAAQVQDFLNDAEVREIFQKTFIEPVHGRKCLAILDLLSHNADPMNTTMREMYLANFMKLIYQLCGIRENRESIEAWLEVLTPGILLAEQQRRAGMGSQ